MQRVVKEILLILLPLHFRRDESRCDCEVGSALPGLLEKKVNVILLQYCYYNFSKKSGSSAGTACSLMILGPEEENLVSPD